MWSPKLKKLVISRDVTFDESNMLHHSKKTSDESTQKSDRDVQQVELDNKVSQIPKSVQPEIEDIASEGEDETLDNLYMSKKMRFL